MAITLIALVAAIAWFVAESPLHQVNVQPVTVTIPVEKTMLASNATSADVSLSGTSALLAPSTFTLTFDFSDLSWLEVKDGKGQILLTGEFPGGQKQMVSGNPPYQVWIGKASAVKVTYRDQPFDLQPYVREEVARFSIDK